MGFLKEEEKEKEEEEENPNPLINKVWLKSTGLLHSLDYKLQESRVILIHTYYVPGPLLVPETHTWLGRRQCPLGTHSSLEERNATKWQQSVNVQQCRQGTYHP